MAKNYGLTNNIVLTNTRTDRFCSNDQVRKWKEITPPKEVKENENRIKTEAF